MKQFNFNLVQSKTKILSSECFVKDSTKLIYFALELLTSLSSPLRMIEITPVKIHTSLKYIFHIIPITNIGTYITNITYD